MIKVIAIFTLSLGIVLAGMTGIRDININIQYAYAHNFTPNSLSTFLTLVYRAQVELSLATNNFPLNVTLASDHAEDAAKLVDDAYYFDDEIVDDTDFVKKYNEALRTRNSTIHALVVANVVDQVLNEYGKAFDIGYDLTNMSNMIMAAPSVNSSSSLSPLSDSVNDPTVTTNSTIQTNNSQPVNIANFQTAQELSKKAYEIFKSKLLSLTSSNNTDTASTMARLDKSMADLNHLVDSKAPAQELMMMVHGQVHPNLQSAYDLKLKQ